MKKVSPGTKPTPEAMSSKIDELCRASQQCTEEIADAYTVTVPSGFVPVREIDLTATTMTLDLLASVVATFLLDLQARGAQRRTSSV